MAYIIQNDQSARSSLYSERHNYLLPSCFIPYMYISPSNSTIKNRWDENGVDPRGMVERVLLLRDIPSSILVYSDYGDFSQTSRAKPGILPYKLSQDISYVLPNSLHQRGGTIAVCNH